MNALENTVRAAQTVLENTSDIDHCITSIDAYVAGLNKLLQELDEGPVQYSAGELEKLEPLHQQVLAVAMNLLGNTSVDLRQLQTKGKAILAYTDTMPKRVSMRSKQKG